VVLLGLGAAVATEVGTPLQPEQRLEEAQDLNQDPKEEEIEDLNKEVVMPEAQGVEEYAAQSLMTPDRSEYPPSCYMRVYMRWLLHV
jgi:hypothetical protein